MSIPDLPEEELKRLQNLYQYDILDTPPEAQFNDLTALAASFCGTPIALISLVDKHRQWFKSRIGLDAQETPRDESFCTHAILGNEIMEVEDALQDERFRNLPLVTREPKIRFYAGLPLLSAEGYKIGTLCVLDHRPRKLTTEQRDALHSLGRLIIRQLSFRRESAENVLNAAFMRAILNNAGDAIIATDVDGFITHFNPAAERMLGYSAGEMLGKCTPVAFHDPAEMERLATDLSTRLGRPIGTGFAIFETMMATQTADSREWIYIRKDGSRLPVWLTITILHDGEDRVTGYLGIARDITEFKKVEMRLRFSEIQKSDALEVIRKQHQVQLDLHDAQDEFIANPGSPIAFEKLLAVLMNQTDAEYGFIGEVLYRSDGAPYLKTHAMTDIAWNEETRRLYEQHKASGMEFSNLKTLFGAVLTTGEPVVANSPATDSRRGGLPPGHPRMDNFLGLPINVGGQMVGMVGVANRPGGFDQSSIDRLEPLLLTYGSLIQARRNQNLKRAAEKQLRESEARLQRVIASSGLGYWEFDPASGRLSGDWPKLLGYDPATMDGPIQNWLALIHPEDLDGVTRTWMDLIENRIALHLVEYRARNTAGEWRWVLCEGRVTQRDAAGKPLSVSGTFKDIHDRKAYEQQSAQLSRNRILLQEVHHRIKNNLQIVSSLLALQQRKAQDAVVAEQLQMSRNRVAAVALLHELLYRSDHMDSIELDRLVSDLSKQVMAAFGTDTRRIRLEISAEPITMDYNQAGSVALILNELLTNSLKHAFPENARGLIRVSVASGEKPGWTRIEMSDDGVGAKPRQGEKNSGSIGMMLVRRLTDQIQGTLTRIPAASGTAWRLDVACKP